MIFEKNLEALLIGKGFENWDGKSGEVNFNRVEYCHGCGGVFKHYFGGNLVKAIPAGNKDTILQYVQQMDIW